MADELIKSGITSLKPLPIHIRIRQFIAKARISRNFKAISRKRKLIVLCTGYPDHASFPFAYNNKIIPVIWDSWPRYWERIIASFKRHNVELAFFTQKQVAEYIHNRLPQVDCIYIPEGLSPQGYMKGESLATRTIDVLELGRLHQPIHKKILEFACRLPINHLYQDTVTPKRLFESTEDLFHGLANSKIVINYPRSITHPQMAGGVETLTQRYWECMYSRCIMVGHAPKELIELVGYNPVIECSVDNIDKILETVLQNINSYQQLVDKNYKTAIQYGSWESRVDIILDKITKL